MFPIFSPLGFMGLAHESRLECFLTFIASICWSLNNLVLAPLPLEVQSWKKMMEFHHLLNFNWCYKPRVLFTSGREWPQADRIASSSFLRTWFSCCTLVRDEQGQFCLLSVLYPLLGSLRLDLFTWVGSFRLGCVHPTKSRTHVAMDFPSSWTFISKYYLGFKSR